jgi:hypothetical protein
MLLEVVETRPQLGCLGATRSEALVHTRFAYVFTMHRLFVTVQVINGCKSYRCAWTIGLDAAILAGVASVVFPAGFGQRRVRAEK